ncbi:MAG: hypothetical protein LBQ75_08340 [Zoogloeaceae bacterium]|jgi:hypothetical protein|nr:hypothetical protein [Zoogloeaceae bacterium]
MTIDENEFKLLLEVSKSMMTEPDGIYCAALLLAWWKPTQTPYDTSSLFAKNLSPKIKSILEKFLSHTARGQNFPDGYEDDMLEIEALKERFLSRYAAMY